MGSGASKSAAQSTLRKFPNRAPGSAVPPLPSSPAATRARAAAPSQQPAQGQRDRPAPAASFSKDEAIRQDGSDPHMSSPDDTIQPDLAQRLRDMGVVQPNPTYSPSSTASPMASPLQQTGNSGPIFPSPSKNPVLSALEARDRFQREADEEFEKMGLSGFQGRRFLHAGTVRDVLVMRERGASEAEIENRFNLKRGLLKRLGPRHLFRPTIGGEPTP